MANVEDPAWRDKVKIGNLMARVLKHANGEVEMTATQLKAADLFLKKTLPDLQRTMVEGGEKPVSIQTNITDAVLKMLPTDQLEALLARAKNNPE